WRIRRSIRGRGPWSSRSNGSRKKGTSRWKKPATRAITMRPASGWEDTSRTWARDSRNSNAVHRPRCRVSASMWLRRRRRLLVDGLPWRLAPGETVLWPLQRDQPDAVIRGVASRRAGDDDLVAGLQRSTRDAGAAELAVTTPLHVVD